MGRPRFCASLKRIIVAGVAGYHLTFGQGTARKESIGYRFAEDCSLARLTVACLTLGAIAVEQIFMIFNEIRVIHGVH